jgi:hypothetical protein
VHLEVWIALKAVQWDERIPAEIGLAPFRAAIGADRAHAPLEFTDSRSNLTRRRSVPAIA